MRISESAELRRTPSDTRFVVLPGCPEVRCSFLCRLSLTIRFASRWRSGWPVPLGFSRFLPAVGLMWVGNSGYVVKVRPLFVGFALGLLSPVGISLFEEVSFSFVV
jgi:hypothetical protein